MIPSTLPDLFEGDQLIVLGQYHTDKPVTFKLTGNFLGQPREFRYQFDLDSATTDAQALPLRSQAVSFFVSRELLEHLPDPLAGASELARIGRAGVIVVPTLDFPFRYDPINYFLAPRNRRLKFGIYGYDHRELFRIAHWRELIERAGLAIRREAPVGTGLLLALSDLACHAAYSWRTFDDLPRHQVSAALAAPLFALYGKMHDLDAQISSRDGASQAFVVEPRLAGS
jgi:hypothetical protein